MSLLSPVHARMKCLAKCYDMRSFKIRLSYPGLEIGISVRCFVASLPIVHEVDLI